MRQSCEGPACASSCANGGAESTLAFVGHKRGCYVKTETYEYVGEGMGEYDTVPRHVNRGCCCCFSGKSSSSWRCCCPVPSETTPGSPGLLFSTTLFCMTALGALGIFFLVAAAVTSPDAGRHGIAGNSTGHHPAEPPRFRCTTGLLDWNFWRWSDEKREWCCHHAEVGCENVGYDCFRGKTAEWPDRQNKWCCKEVGLGCSEDDFNCKDSLENWTVAWTFAKKSWCCSQGGPCEGFNTSTSAGSSSTSTSTTTQRHLGAADAVQASQGSKKKTRERRLATRQLHGSKVDKDTA